MTESGRKKVTDLLAGWRRGEDSAVEQLLPLVYQELRQLARKHMAGERRGHTLQTTALVHEACIRLVGADVEWQDRVHFFAVASRVMREILVDYARARRREKRGGGAIKLPIDEALDAAEDATWDLVDLDLALHELAGLHARQAHVIELHYFGGMKLDEIADVLATTHGSVAWDLRMGKAWLRRKLGGPSRHA